MSKEQRAMSAERRALSREYCATIFLLLSETRLVENFDFCIGNFPSLLYLCTIVLGTNILNYLNTLFEILPHH